MIIKVIIKCYKPEVSLLELATLLDTTLQGQGYEVQEVSTTIMEDEDEESKTEIHSSGQRRAET